MKEIYQKYIEAKKTGWSEASVRSEGIRLNKVMHLLGADPGQLWVELGNIYSKHTRVTVYNRVTCFFDWAIKKGHMAGPNQYSLWREENPRCFQGFYTRKPSGITFADLMKRLARISDEEVRNKLIQLATSGMRWTESGTLTQDGFIVGKGNKPRRVYPIAGLGPMVPIKDYRRVLRILKTIDIKGPHMIRKIFLTEMVRRGMGTFELMETAGWSKLDTAQSYIAANQETIKNMVGSLHAEVVT